jgi:hypothetical protein
MSITATVKNGTIKLPPGMHLPDGTQVHIEPQERRESRPREPMRAVPDFVARQRASGMSPFTREETEAFDRWLAGEPE